MQTLITLAPYNASVVMSRNTESDGSIDINKYDVNPLELEYGPQGKHNVWSDNTNSRTNYLKQIADSELWVCYRKWQTGRNEYGYSIKGIGEVGVVAVDLDTGSMADSIRNEAEPLAFNDDYPDDVALGEKLMDHADELAAELEDDWARGVEEIVGEAIHDGTASVDGTLTWVSHVEEAYYHEAEHALRALGIDDNEAGSGVDILRGVLSSAVSNHTSRYRNPHAEYIGRLIFDVEPWHLRALELQQSGGFPKQTARVVALNEVESMNRDIADQLGVGPSTVSRHLDRAERIVDEAKWTVRNVEL